MKRCAQLRVWEVCHVAIEGRAAAANPSLVKNEAVLGGITIGGQPSPDELTSGRFKNVVNIRGAAEAGNVSGDVLPAGDISYTSVPWTIDTVTKDDIDRIRAAVDASDGPVLIH